MRTDCRSLRRSVEVQTKFISRHLPAKGDRESSYACFGVVRSFSYAVEDVTAPGFLSTAEAMPCRSRRAGRRPSVPSGTRRSATRQLGATGEASSATWQVSSSRTPEHRTTVLPDTPKPFVTFLSQRTRCLLAQKDSRPN